MLRTLTATTAIALLLGAGSALATPTVSGTLSVYVGNNTNGSSTTPLSSYGTADSAHTSWEGKFTGTAPAYLAGERAVYADLNALTAGTNPATATLTLGKNTPFTPITMVMDYTSGSATLSVRSTQSAGGHYSVESSADPYYNSSTANNYILASVANLEMKFTGANHVHGVGFYLTDFADTSANDTSVTIYHTDGTSITYALTDSGGCTIGTNCISTNTSTLTDNQNGAVTFIGLYDTNMMDRIVFSTTSGDAIGISNLELAVPEPTSVAVLGAGLLALGAARMRRKSAVAQPTDETGFDAEPALA